MRSGVFSWAFGLLFAVLAAGSAFAQDDGDWEPHDRVAAGQIQPLDRILPEIRRTHPGTFYDAEGPFTGPDGEMHYRLKWMTPDGRIVWYDANARTGRVMGSGSGRRDYQSFDTGPMRGGPDQYNGNGQRYGDEQNDGRDRFGPDGYNGQGNGAPPPPPPPGWGGPGRGNGHDWGGPGWGHDRGNWGGRGWQGGGRGWQGGRGGGGGDHHGHGGHGG